MTLLHSLTHPSRIHDVKFCKHVEGNSEVLLVAAEDKKLSVYDVPSDKNKTPAVIAELIGHSNRSVRITAPIFRRIDPVSLVSKQLIHYK